MEKCKFMSVFAPYMQKFVDAKEAAGVFQGNILKVF